MKKVTLVLLVAFIGIAGIVGLSSVYASTNIETLYRADGKQMTIELDDNIEYDKITLDEIQEARERRD